MEFSLIQNGEIAEVCELIGRACRQSAFAGFYPPLPQYFTASPEEIKERAGLGHFYVGKVHGKIVVCGGIGPYWGSETESWLFMIFVDPELQGKGLGSQMVHFLERDEYALRASRLEIHAAISAIPFYRKLGYEHKNGRLSYSDGHFDLEKYTKL